jgi:c-di-GMP-binding flagellar brake protein YcgR
VDLFFDGAAPLNTISYMYDVASSVPNRRADPRFRVQMFLNQYVRDRAYRALAFDISETGLAIQKLTEPIVRSARVVNLELQLPGTREIIWAAAESRFDEVGADFHISGLAFSAMAGKHERLIRDYVRERQARLVRLLPRA